MTTLPNRPNTALLIVDMQNDVVKAAHARDAVITNIARLVDKARRKDVTAKFHRSDPRGKANGGLLR